jgi:hypothetical protein
MTHRGGKGCRDPRWSDILAEFRRTGNRRATARKFGISPAAVQYIERRTQPVPRGATEPVPSNPRIALQVVWKWPTQ